MHYIDLITRLNNLTRKEEVVVQFKALRQDALIWEEFKQLTENSAVVVSLARQKMPINPGTLALLIFDPEFDFSTLNARMASREALEKIMFGFEEYIQTDKPLATLRQAGALALALIEKRKAVSNWVEIFQDIVTRMKINDGEKFYLFWGTVFVVVTNLIEEKEEFFRDLTVFQQAELSVEILIHLVLCLPRGEEEKVEILRRYLYPLSPQKQVLALKQLKKMAGGSLCGQVATRILDKYHQSDNTKKSTRDHWRDPVSSMHYAFQCQAAADIAQLAGNTDTAAELNDKALETLSALLKMSKVKKAGIVYDSAAAAIPVGELFSAEELADPEILSELAYTNAGLDLSLTGEVSIAKIMQQAKKMQKAGNTDLAREELRENLKQLSASEFEQVLESKPHVCKRRCRGKTLHFLNQIFSSLYNTIRTFCTFIFLLKYLESFSSLLKRVSIIF